MPIGSLVVGLGSVSHYEPRLVDSVSVLVMSMAPLTSTIPSFYLTDDNWTRQLSMTVAEYC